MDTYKTDNLAIACFLKSRGVEHIKTEWSIGKNNKYHATFIFNNEKDSAKKIYKLWNNSPEQIFKNEQHYFRNEIREAQKEQEGREKWF